MEESVFQQVELVSETKSSPAYIRGNIDLKHEFSIKEDNSNFPNVTRLLRIDIWDKYFLNKFSIIHLGTGEDLTARGKIYGDENYFHWLCVSPPPGKYQIRTVGGNYHYKVLLIKSDRTITDAVQCKVNNAAEVILRLPEKYVGFHKLVSYRADNNTIWETVLSKHPHKEIKLQVVPTSAYEVKMKLFVKDAFESDYSPPINITEHQRWADTLEPDPYLLDVALTFYFKMEPWPYKANASLQINISGEDSRWNFSEEISPINYGFVLFPLVWALYDRLENDTTVEWQLQFQEPHSFASPVKSSIRKFEFKKRKIEKFHPAMVLETNSKNLALYLASDGRFLLKRKDGALIMPAGLKGNYSLQNISDNKKRIRLIPKYGNISFHDAIDRSRSSGSLTLPEIMLVIFQYTSSPPISFYAGKFKQLKNLALVCKYWFKLFTKTFDKLDGVFELGAPGLQTKVKFDNWLEFTGYVEGVSDI
jgi:hypothetical protein